VLFRFVPPLNLFCTVVKKALWCFQVLFFSFCDFQACEVDTLGHRANWLKVNDGLRDQPAFLSCGNVLLTLTERISYRYVDAAVKKKVDFGLLFLLRFLFLDI